MNRFQFVRLTVFVFSFAVLNLASSSTANAQETDFLDQELTPELVEQYEQKLNAILKTRTDQEKVFVARLVDKVQQGKIPMKLVSTSFTWVQENRSETNYPFIYFEKVIRLQASQVGVVEAIPPFDFDFFRSAGQREAGQQLNAGQKTESQSESLLSTARTRIAKLFRSFPGSTGEGDTSVR